MAKIKWMIESSANKELEDGTTVSLFQGAEFEANEHDPYIARAIAREWAVVISGKPKDLTTEPISETKDLKGGDIK